MASLPSPSPAPASPPGPAEPLDVHGLLRGCRLLLMGGTGFLGKVWLSMLLFRFPEVGHVYLVVRERRGRDGSLRQSSEARFWAEVATSPVFDPLRTKYPGLAFEAFLRDKITPITGDVTLPFAGVPEDIRAGLRGTLDALVNSAGVVDFNPPLDYSLNVNAFGMQNLIALARDVSTAERPLRFLHTSTCYVAGDRTGQVDEIDPRLHPFPRADILERAHWDPAREIAECMDLVEHVRHRSADAFRQSAFLDEAKKNLRAKGEPARGSTLQDELDKVKRRYEERRLIDGGTERAKYWGWHNIYTYTKSIGEQILCGSGLPFTIVRPAVIESSLEYPRKGWNEGINTSAPLIYLANVGKLWIPSTSDSVLDVIPCDQVAVGMILSLCELLEGRAAVVYQYGSSDSAPLRVERLIELVSLEARAHKRREGRGNPVVNWLSQRLEATGLSVQDYEAAGPQVRADQVKRVAGWVGRLQTGPLSSLTRPAASALQGMAKGLEITARISDQFLPFTATHSYRFSAANTRRAYARLSEDDKVLLPWRPESIDWYDYIMSVHNPGLRENVFPQIKDKISKPRQPLRRHDHLLDLLDESAEQFDLVPALLRTHDEGFERISYRELRQRAHAVARRLVAAGVERGDRILLSGQNHPDWPIAYFGILRAGAIAVPLDPTLDEHKAANIQRSAQARLAILDSKARDSFGGTLGCESIDLHAVAAWLEEGTAEAAAPLPTWRVSADDVASILYTSGTTGDPKGVMLTHGNFTALLGSLGRIFPLTEDDRILSVLPLHHTFEFSCGLLLPLSLGAQIIYLDEITGERLSYGLQQGRVTGMVGVPALWQMLERRISGQMKEQGELFNLLLGGAMEMNRQFGRSTGLDLGRLLFNPVHDRLGGNIRFLISGGAALPRETQDFFNGLGLHLSEGYGLTEASPVLTVAEAAPGAKGGNVGRPIPGVEVRIHAPDESGVGEVIARGPSVMLGYYGNDAATQGAIDEAGWLHTGDIGRLDHRGRLILMGRAKEVVVTATGENIYLDDVENALGSIRTIKEYVLVGVEDPRGGERLGMLAVIEPPPAAPSAGRGAEPGRTARYDEAMEAIKRAVGGLPAYQRPAVIKLVEADLPRTASRKVQRKDARRILEKIVAATPTKARRGSVSEPVARAVAAVAGVEIEKIQPGTRLQDDLGFDSLMAVELAAALSGVGHANPDPDQVAACETVADLVALVGAAIVEAQEEEEKELAQAERLHIPSPIAVPLKRALGVAQMTLYGQGLRARVVGRANIPANRPTIVISNHCSHLDMGLVKYSLGGYGRKLVALAAKDYFFEGNRWWVAYFEQLTNLQPIDRKRGFRASFEQARQVVESGHTVLLFPEGTRRTDGTIGEFKPLIGKLSLETGTDLLPVHLEGTFRILPKGAILPKGRSVTVRIGPPLRIDQLRRLTAGLRPSDAARVAARLSQEAVARLSEGSVLDLDHDDVTELIQATIGEGTLPVVDPVEAAFSSLPARFDPARMERASLSWYFSLGGSDGPRWTVIVSREGGCIVQPGKPPGGSADCVVKTSPETMVRIIQKAYVPDPAEFFSGAIKTSEIPLLIEFSRVFALSEVPA